MKHIFHYKYLFYIVAFTSLSNFVMAQAVPDWFNEGNRKLYYPDNAYYIGMAYAEVTSSEGAAVQNAEMNAKAEALSKILVSVKSRTTYNTVSNVVVSASGMDEKYIETFSSLTNLDIAFKDVPGLQCQHYRNGSTVAAFAYVKKADLARYYDRRITSLLTKIEMVLDNADEYVKHGDKIKARNTAQTAIQYVADLDNAQRILLAVSNDADIRTADASVLTKRLVAMLSDLKNSTAIYVDSKVYDAQNEPYGLFSNALKAKLSNIGCNFVNSREQADWVVSVEADIVRKNQASGAYFVWVDGAVAIRNNTTSQVIYNGKLSAITADGSEGIKGGHSAGFDQATAKAYDNVAKIVGNKIIEILKQ